MTERRRETSDEDLARTAGRGDLAAFQSLVGRHQQRIFSLALRLARDRAEAEDMAQEAFLRIYRGLGSFRGESQFSTWMIRVALNTFNRYLRRLPRTGPLPERELAEDAGPEASTASPTGPPHGNPELLLAAREEAAQVRRLVAALPARFRDVVTVYYLNERSSEEAAEALGISVGTLKSRLFRAREMLLERWKRTQSSDTGHRERHERRAAAALTSTAEVGPAPGTSTPRREDSSRAHLRGVQTAAQRVRCMS